MICSSVSGGSSRKQYMHRPTGPNRVPLAKGVIHLVSCVETGSKDDQYSPEETARRRDEAIRRALNIPPKPQKEMLGKSRRTVPKLPSRLRLAEKK
jgi:hypothetical protein